jgi:FkbM family methyltransferase
LSFTHSLVRALPLALFRPFRMGAVALRRGSLPRKLCVAVLQVAARAQRGRLPSLVGEVVPLDAPDLRFKSVDSMVLDAVYWFGVQGYEGRVADVWVALAGRARSVLEVGGNVGLFSVLGGRARRGRYSVVEPVPSIAAVLRENLARNGCGGVEVIEAAAVPGAAETEVILNIPDEGRGAPVGSFVTGATEMGDRQPGRRLAVRGVPFRALIAGRDLVKIDAEGLEADLLASARDIILAERPTLMIEVLPSAPRLAALLAELAEAAGYTIHVLPEWGSDSIVTVPAAGFTADMPGRHNSKDVVLTVAPLPAPG